MTKLENLVESKTNNSNFSEFLKQHLIESCKFENEKEGNLKGYDCKICRNKGLLYETQQDMYIVVKNCSCVKIRLINERLDKSGLKDLFEKYTFENFTTKKDHHKHMKTMALKFLEKPNKWFYIGGQVGSGKSHISVALSKELILKGYDFEYLNFARDFRVLQRKIESGFTDVREKAERDYERLVNVKVLYIDDFLKGGINDQRLLFSLINDRYALEDNITIFSSEKLFNELLSIDEAFSRIKERAGEFIVNISQKEGRNERLKR